MLNRKMQSAESVDKASPSPGPLKSRAKLEAEVLRLKRLLRQRTVERETALHTVSSLRRSESAIQGEYAKLLSAVHQGEDHLRLALEGSKLGSWDWDIQSDSIVLSERAAKILGLPAGCNADYESFLAAIHPNDREPTHKAAQAALSSGGVYEAEYRVVWPDGSIHWVSATGRSFFNSDNKSYRALGLVQDITEKKKTQAAQLSSEARANARAQELEALMNSAPTGIFVAQDPQCRTITANHAGSELLRLEPGMAIHDILPGGDPRTAFRAQCEGKELRRKDLPMHVAGRIGQEVTMQFDVIFPDGVIRAIHGTAAPLRDEEGNIRGVIGTFLDMTAQKLVEKELARSRRLFERIAATVPDVLYIFDLNLDTLVYANCSLHDMLGYSAEHIGKFPNWTLEKLIHPDDRATHNRSNLGMRSVPDGEILEAEFRVRHVNGSYRWMRTRTVAFSRNPDNTVRQILGLARDTTAEHQAREALQETQGLYRILTDLSPQIVWRTNAQGVLDYCNDNWSQLTGLTLDQSKQGGWFSAIHPDYREQIQTGWAHAMASGREYQIEIPIRRADGLYRWYMGHTIPVRNPEGDIIHWVGSAYDNHDQKESEQALRESEQRFRMLADTAPVMIWMTNEHGDSTYVNQQTIAFTGQAPNQRLATIPPYIHSDDFSQGFQTQLAGLRDRVPFQSDYRQRRHDGAYRWTTCHGQPRLSPDGTFLGFIGIMLDITEHKEAEAALRHQQSELQTTLAQAQNAQKEAEAAGLAKDQFLAVLSHELRTPLTPVLIAAATIQAQKGLPDRVYEAMAMIRSNIKLEARLIDDLLDLTHINRSTMNLAMERIDVHQVIDRAVETCTPELNAGSHQLTLSLDASAPIIEGDFTRLQQVVWNLLKNAVKFTAPGGNLQLRTMNLGPVLRIELEDNGIGIDAATLPMIFNSFEQGSQDVVRQYGGLGLGLAIAKAIIEGHGGRISATSAGKNSGSLFAVELPQSLS